MPSTETRTFRYFCDAQRVRRYEGAYTNRTISLSAFLAACHTFRTAAPTRQAMVIQNIWICFMKLGDAFLLV